MLNLNYFCDSLESYETARETIEALINEGFSMEDILNAYYSNRYSRYFISREAWMDKEQGELRVFDGVCPSKKTLFFAELFREYSKVAVIDGVIVKVYGVEELYAGMDPKDTLSRRDFLNKYYDQKIALLKKEELEELC